jgi:hypothetical protein
MVRAVIDSGYLIAGTTVIISAPSFFLDSACLLL